MQHRVAGEAGVARFPSTSGGSGHQQSCPESYDSETGFEWALLQSNPARPDLAEKLDESDLGNANEAVTRRYEFYKYTGAYDPENHEALSDTYDPALVGDYLGNQNVAANFAIPEPGTFVLGAVGMTLLGFFAARRKGTSARS